MAQRRAPDCLVPAPPAAKNKNLFPSPPLFFFLGAGERAQPGARFWLPSPLRQLTAGLDESERKEKERGKPALFGGSGLRARCGRPGKQTRCSLVPHPLHPRVPGVFKPPGQRGFAVPGIDPDPVAERPWRGGELRRGERRAGPAGNGACPKLLLWIRHKRDPKRLTTPSAWGFDPGEAMPAAPFGAEDRDHKGPGISLPSRRGGDAAFRGERRFVALTRSD